MRQDVVIDPRFNGPPNSANGGYACGLVASAVGPRATAKLRLPPPVGVPLVLEGAGDGSARLLDGDALVAEAEVAEPTSEPPAPPSAAEAEDAASRFKGRDPADHVFPTCFVCGPQRAEHDGLRLFPGPVRDDSLLACTWTPEPELAGDDGVVDPLFVWSALDCPSGFACIPPGTVTVLASLTARVDEPVHAGRTYVVTGWPVSSEGRKHFAGSAIHDPEGRAVAVAEALWITMR